MPTKPSLPAPTIPAKLFPEMNEMNVAVAGRFSYFPSKDELLEFLKREGANIADSATADLHLLIVGSGAKSALQKQVEKLNATGAGIQIIDDFEQLFQFQVIDSIANLIDSSTLAHLCAIPDFVVNRATDFRFTGDDFSGQTIDGGKEPLEASRLSFHGCNFRKAQIRNLRIRNYHRHYGSSRTACLDNCSLEQSTLQGVAFGTAARCRFEKALLKDVEFTQGTELTFNQCTIETLAASSLLQCTLQKCKVDSWQMNNYRASIDNCKFIDCNIHKLSFSNDDSGEIKASELRRCTIEDCNLSAIAFNNCTLEEVTFRKIQFGSLVFNNCTVSNCTFDNCSLANVNFRDSTLSGCRARKSTAIIVTATDGQITELKGIEINSEVRDLSKLAVVAELARLSLVADRLQFSIDGKTASGQAVSLQFERDYRLSFSYSTPTSSQPVTFTLGRYGQKATQDDAVEGLVRMVQESELDGLDLGSLQSKSSKSPIKANELKKLIVAAIYEAMGKEAQSDEELASAQKQAKEATQQLRQKMLNQLNNGQVAAFNMQTAAERKQVASLKKLQLSNAALPRLNASGLDLAESDFSHANLESSNLSGCSLRKTLLRHTNLRNADLKQANLRGSDLSHANLTGAKLQQVTLDDAILQDTILDSADLSKTNLAGVDLSKSRLSAAIVKGAFYDEKTSLPIDLPIEVMKTMQWIGGGVAPHDRKLNTAAAGPIDFPKFMERLAEITDSSRLQKSMQMLKKDSFKLFCEVAADSVTGVVKSQSDPDLVYSCMLNERGEFTCCTQNLNPCGGLRGAICKHILVLVVGLAKGNELDPTKIDSWVNQSKLKSPSLNKDRMSEVLLKYKGAEAGEIDWRPTETVPEDFFAF